MQPITDTQKSIAQAIVNIFETGSIRGDYSRVTLIAGDTGQLTFGRSQVTLTSGNLYELIATYVERPGARFADALSPFLPVLEVKDARLNDDLHFHNLLRASADDPVMRDTQDELFDSKFWASSIRIARRDDLATPLAVAVVFDSLIHGSWRRIRRQVNAALGRPEEVGERRWIASYIGTRHDWLANHRRRDLRATTYRTETFGQLIEQEAWLLEMPLLIRNQEIHQQTLYSMPPWIFEGPEPRSREVLLTSPMQRGLDVRLIQLALSGTGFRLRADGIYGRASKGAMEAFQRDRGLQVTGSVGSADFGALGL